MTGKWSSFAVKLFSISINYPLLILHPHPPPSTNAKSPPPPWLEIWNIICEQLYFIYVKGGGGDIIQIPMKTVGEIFKCNERTVTIPFPFSGTPQLGQGNQMTGRDQEDGG